MPPTTPAPGNPAPATVDDIERLILLGPYIMLPPETLMRV